MWKDCMGRIDLYTESVSWSIINSVIYAEERRERERELSFDEEQSKALIKMVEFTAESVLRERDGLVSFHIILISTTTATTNNMNLYHTLLLLSLSLRDVFSVGINSYRSHQAELNCELYTWSISSISSISTRYLYYIYIYVFSSAILTKYRGSIY